MAHDKRPKNEVQVFDGVAYVKMRGGYTARLDAKDWERISGLYMTWVVNRCEAGVCAVARRVSDGKHTKMHRAIMEPALNQVVDHINHDRLDNRRCNLRNVTNELNSHNRIAQRGSRSGVNGVTLAFGTGGKWRARVRYRGKLHELGYFKTIDEAADAVKAEKGRLGLLP